MTAASLYCAACAKTGPLGCESAGHEGPNVRHERQTKGAALWLSARWRGSAPTTQMGRFSCSFGVKPHAERPRYLEDSGEAGIPGFAERLVQTLAAEPSIASHLRHALGASDVTERAGNARRIVGGLGKPSVKVGGHLFGRAQLFRHV